MLLTVTLAAQVKPCNTRQHLDSILDRWHSDAASGDLKSYMGAMDSGAVFLGTDPLEYWTKSQFSVFCKPYFDRKTTWTFKAVSRNIYIDAGETFAWFDELLITQMGLCRGSGVLTKKGKGWLLEQYVLSPTVPNDLMKKVTAMKLAEDTVLMMKAVFEKYRLKGTILLYDPSADRYSGYSPSLWDTACLPASTFKIPNSLIGLETGVIDTSTVFRWDGKKRRLPQWERDLSLREAFAVSCVPCYQEVARKIGADRMKDYLGKMNYGTMDVTAANIDVFWLEGNSKISPRQQVSFLQRLHDGKLPLKPSTMAAVKSIMVNETGPGWTLSGKTGWAVRNGKNHGWFVGYLERGGGVTYIATLVWPENNELPGDFATARKYVTMDVLRLLSLIP